MQHLWPCSVSKTLSTSMSKPPLQQQNFPVSDRAKPRLASKIRLRLPASSCQQVNGDTFAPSSGASLFSSCYLAWVKRKYIFSLALYKDMYTIWYYTDKDWIYRYIDSVFIYIVSYSTYTHTESLSTYYISIAIFPTYLLCFTHKLFRKPIISSILFIYIIVDVCNGGV